MSRKAPNGEGSVAYRADRQRWEGRISLPSGRRRSFYAKTRTEVAKRLRAALQARDAGLPIIGDRQTVAQYLASWLEAVKPSLRPRTWTRYEQYVRLGALPYLGRLPLAKLSPQHLSHLYAKRLGACPFIDEQR